MLCLTLLMPYGHQYPFAIYLYIYNYIYRLYYTCDWCQLVLSALVEELQGGVVLSVLPDAPMQQHGKLRLALEQHDMCNINAAAFCLAQRFLSTPQVGLSGHDL